MPAPSEEGFRAVSSDASCRFTVSGCRFDCTNTYKSRNQSQEAGTSSRIFGSMETSAKYISQWVLQTIEKWNQIQLEQEVKALLEKGAIQYVLTPTGKPGFTAGTS